MKPIVPAVVSSPDEIIVFYNKYRHPLAHISQGCSLSTIFKDLSRLILYGVWYGT